MPDNRRAPAQPRDIDSINPRQDIRVRIVGTILEKAEDSAMIDDGSGTTEVFLDQDDLDQIEESQKVRIIGRVLPTPDSFEVQGEIVQQLGEKDIELYNRVSKAITDI